MNPWTFLADEFGRPYFLLQGGPTPDELQTWVQSFSTSALENARERIKELEGSLLTLTWDLAIACICFSKLGKWGDWSAYSFHQFFYSNGKLENVPAKGGLIVATTCKDILGMKAVS